MVNLSSRLNSVTVQENSYKCKKEFRINKQGQVVENQPIWIQCSDCGKYIKINPSCGLRNCKRCMGRRSRKLERKYLPPIIAMQNRRGSMWTFVTLTGIRIPRNYQMRKTIQRFTNTATQFLKQEYELGGLGTLEHTVRPSQVSLYGEIVQEELYVHYHAVVYGGFKEVYGLAGRWFDALLEAGLITLAEDNRHDGRRSVTLSLVRNPKATAKYILKYVAKGVELPDEEVEVLARLKYVRSWGLLYNVKEPTFDMICADCGAKCYVTLDGIPFDFSDPPPERKLTIRMVERPP